MKTPPLTGPVKRGLYACPQAVDNRAAARRAGWSPTDGRPLYYHRSIAGPLDRAMGSAWRGALEAEPTGVLPSAAAKWIPTEAQLQDYSVFRSYGITR